ncbi:MAG: hypothetical protein M1828_002132 [Chrysothrix sp. TS-e1954]|nr:MAG: hypothetical protein M1828_002132 [Chrysothrix sp. TS-e1954]
MDSSKDSPVPSGPAASSPELPQRRPSLLPAFEPASSSPTLPRPAKRKLSGSHGGRAANFAQYPTPVPTSSTGIIPSSSPSKLPKTRPSMQRTASCVSERVPLGDVPSIYLRIDGQPVLFGRSSNSSTYQLSANRLISRVHVKAFYRAGTEPLSPGQVRIECLGWNGAKLHCQGQAFELGKSDSFTSDKPDAEIMLDVQDARVLIRWPILARPGSLSAVSDDSPDEELSPRRISTPEPQHLPSSPPAVAVHLHSPISPSPRIRQSFTASSTFIGLPASSENPVQVYEDHVSEDEVEDATQPDSPSQRAARDPAVPNGSQVSSALSSPESISDRDEENDPIIAAFGPFGDNLLPRMASFSAVSPQRRREPLRASVSPKQPTAPPKIDQVFQEEYGIELSPIRNHVINQLAFSRLHALPLSTIMNNLPASLKQGPLTQSVAAQPTKVGKTESVGSPAPARTLRDVDLKKLLDDTACVGEIMREGKDASGKKLENEFYYVHEMDSDHMRKSAVENSLGKPGLREVRKQHKVSSALLNLVLYNACLYHPIAILLEAASSMRFRQSARVRDGDDLNCRSVSD